MQMNGILLKSLNDVNQGKSPDFTELDIDKNVEFYIVGIAPNVSRLAQKFIYRDKFGNIFSHIARHQADMMIVNSKGNIPRIKTASKHKLHHTAAAYGFGVRCDNKRYTLSGVFA